MSRLAAPFASWVQVCPGTGGAFGVAPARTALYEQSKGRTAKGSEAVLGDLCLPWGKQKGNGGKIVKIQEKGGRSCYKLWGKSRSTGRAAKGARQHFCPADGFGCSSEAWYHFLQTAKGAEGRES